MSRKIGVGMSPAATANRCAGMTLFLIQPSTLIALANRCLIEHASRALDAEIYCAVHGVTDGNERSTPFLVAAHRRGEVLIASGNVHGWVQAPLFTEDLASAKALIPDGVSTISRSPGIVCATALTIMAITDTFLVHQPCAA